jgi:hypothetical protein
MPLKNDEPLDFSEFDFPDSLTDIRMSAYIKPSIVNNEPVWSVYTSDGSVFAVLPNKATAEAVVSQNDFNLVSLN